MAEEYRALCKDCEQEFGYSEASLQSGGTRGLSRPERCPACRRTHSRESRTIGIPQIPLKPKGPRKPDSELEPGRLGKIHHPERFHKKVQVEGKFGRPDSHIEFGITDDDIRLLFEAMQKFQVTVVVGPTGSGKSTLLPYRLMVPPEGVAPDIFTRYGQIVITQPRTQATRNIAKFVAQDLHGCSLGAGFDVGFRHRDAPASDWRNKLVYVTDGTLINWIVSGQISNLSVIMIDEAHERSLNIDLILGLLKKQLPRYPHLKLIIASATINAQLFQTHFGGPEKVAILKFRGLKQHRVDAYFPDHDFMLRNDRMVPDHMARKANQILVEIAEGRKSEGDILGFLTGEGPIERCVALLKQAVLTDARLRDRGINIYPLYATLPQSAQDQALARKTRVIRDRVMAAIKSEGDQNPQKIAALLLDRKSAEEAAELIRKALAEEGNKAWEVILADPEQPVLGTHPRQIVVTAHGDYPSMQGVGFDREISDRRVIISTNVAETSLTVDGTVYVVDSGLINQASWDSGHSARELNPIFHSRAGCRQRMGRAGRVRDGEAHLLYTDEQFEDEEIFPPHTVPEIQRSSLDQVVLKAKAAGIHDIKNFNWIQPPPGGEIDRVVESLGQMGALDDEGDLTHYGMELGSYVTEVPTANLLIMADQYACGVEMATLAAILPVRVFGGLLQWNRDWDFTSREQVEEIYRRFISFCRDDLEVYLKIYSLYTEAKNETERDYLCRSFFIDREVMESKVLPIREKFLEMLSIGKKGAEDRTINFDLLDRLRMVLALALPEQFICRMVTNPDGVKVVSSGGKLAHLAQEIDDRSALSGDPGDLFLCLQRYINTDREGNRRVRLSGLVKAEEQWLALRDAPPLRIAAEIAEALKGKNINPGSTRHRVFFDVHYPLRAEFRISDNTPDGPSIGEQLSRPDPFIPVLSDGKFGLFGEDPEENPEDISALSGWEDKGDGSVSYDPEEETIGDLQEEISLEEDDQADEGIEDGAEERDNHEASTEKVFTADYMASETIKPAWRSLEVSTRMEAGLVVGHEFSDLQTPLLVLQPYSPGAGARDIPPRSTFTDGQRIKVKKLGIRQMPNGENALSVQETATGREFTLDASNITFWGRWVLVDEFEETKDFDAIIRITPEGVPRITMLPLLENPLHSFIKKNRRNPVQGRMIQQSDKMVYFLLMPSETVPKGICIDGRLKLKPHQRINFNPGELRSLKIDSKTGTGSVTIPNPSEELLRFVKMEGKGTLSWQPAFYRLQAWQPLTASLMTRLCQFSEDRGFREAIRSLYRYSNRIHLYLPPPRDVEAPTGPDAREAFQQPEVPEYQPGDLVTGKVKGVSRFPVEVDLEQGGRGIITAAHLSWKRLLSPSEKLASGQRIEARVVSQENQDVILTLLHEEDCPLKNFKEGQDYEATIYKVETDYALAKVGDEFAGLIPKSEVDNKFVVDVHQHLRPGDKVKAKVIKVVVDLRDFRNPGKMTLSIKKTPQHREIKIPEKKVGFLIGNKGGQIKQIQTVTGARVWCEKSGLVDISSKSVSSINQAITRIKELIPEAEIAV